MKPSHFFLLLLIIAIWGFNFVVVKIGLAGLPPIFLCFTRFFLTSIPAIFFFRPPSVSFKWIALYGTIAFALQFTLLFLGMQLGMTSGLTALVLQTQVFFTLFLALFFLNETLRPLQLIGGLIAFSGIALIGIQIKGAISSLGLILVLCAAFCWALGSIFSKKMGPANRLSLVIWSSLIAWPPLLALSLFLEGPSAICASLQNLSWTSTGAILYIAYFSTLLGFGVWNRLLNFYSLSSITPFTLLVPFIGLASSALVLGEPMESWKLHAGLLIVGGLCVHLASSRFTAKQLSKKLP